VRSTIGIARNQPDIREYLNKCPAVESFTETDDRMITFKFDPNKKPDDAPEGIFFDLSQAPF